MFSGFGDHLKKLQEAIPDLNSLQQDDETDGYERSKAAEQEVTPKTAEDVKSSEPGQKKQAPNANTGDYFGFTAPALSLDKLQSSGGPTSETGLQRELEETRWALQAEGEQRKGFQEMVRKYSDEQAAAEARIKAFEKELDELRSSKKQHDVKEIDESSTTQHAEAEAYRAEIEALKTELVDRTEAAAEVRSLGGKLSEAEVARTEAEARAAAAMEQAKAEAAKAAAAATEAARQEAKVDLESLAKGKLEAEESLSR